jgi:hypothetical protein
VWNKVFSLFLCLALAAVPAVAQVPADPDVAKGVKQVEEGDYDAAILTLDNAARRLSADASKSRELSYAYLYLGIAYMGKGHEAAAKAKFREAVSRVTDLSLSPDRFSPKIIDLFEAVKEETTRGGPKAAGAPTPAAAPAAATPAATPPAAKTPPPATVAAAKTGEGGGGSGKTLLFVGLGVAVAGGAALLLAGGGGDECLATVGVRNGRLSADGPAAEFAVGRRASGEMSADLSWRSVGGPADVEMVVLGPASNPVAFGARTTSASRRAAWTADQRATRLRLELRGNTPVEFSLSMPDPCP